jgi:hypothetical protein
LLNASLRSRLKSEFGMSNGSEFWCSRPPPWSPDLRKGSKTKNPGSCKPTSTSIAHASSVINPELTAPKEFPLREYIRLIIWWLSY